MKAYHDLLRTILDSAGYTRPDRTGTGTLSIFGHNLAFDLQEGFPLVTTKKVHFKSVVAELLWMISGSTNVKDLHKHGVTIWDEWADSDGYLGPIYGAQWRRFETRGASCIDQLARLETSLQLDPYSRRHIVTAWNPAALPEMALPPCHMMFQMYVQGNGELDCHMYQRSCDAFLGLPFNIASYALLTHLLAVTCELKPGRLLISFGDVHIYKNHIEQVRLQLTREPYPLPKIAINPELTTIFDAKIDDIGLIDYKHHPAIKADVSV